MTYFSRDLLGIIICYWKYRVVGKYMFKVRNKKLNQQGHIENPVKHQRRVFAERKCLTEFWIRLWLTCSKLTVKALQQSCHVALIHFIHWSLSIPIKNKRKLLIFQGVEKETAQLTLVVHRQQLRKSCETFSKVNDVILVFLFLTLNIFNTFFSFSIATLNK